MEDYILENSDFEKDLWVHEKQLSISSQCNAAAIRANAILRYINKGILTRNMEVVLPLHTVLVRPLLYTVSSSGAHTLHRMLTNWKGLEQSYKNYSRSGKYSLHSKTQKLHLFNLSKRKLKGRF